MTVFQSQYQNTKELVSNYLYFSSSSKHVSPKLEDNIVFTNCSSALIIMNESKNLSLQPPCEEDIADEFSSVGKLSLEQQHRN